MFKLRQAAQRSSPQMFIYSFPDSSSEAATAVIDLLRLVKVAAADVAPDVGMETAPVKGQRLACVSHLKAFFVFFLNFNLRTATSGCNCSMCSALRSD